MQSATLLTLLLAAAAQPETGIEALKQNATYKELAAPRKSISDIDQEIMFSRSALARKIVYSHIESDPEKPPFETEVTFTVSPDSKLTIVDIPQKRGRKMVKSGKKKIQMAPSRTIRVSPTLRTHKESIRFWHQDTCFNYTDFQYGGTVYGLEDGTRLFSATIDNINAAQFYMVAADERCATLHQTLGYIKTILEAPKTKLPNSRALIPVINAKSSEIKNALNANNPGEQAVTFNLQNYPTYFSMQEHGGGDLTWGSIIENIEEYSGDSFKIEPNKALICWITDEFNDTQFVARCTPETYLKGLPYNDPNMLASSVPGNFEVHIK